MEKRLASILERLGQADRALRERGEDPEPFMLIYAMGGSADVEHPAWDPSWPTPTVEDVDDLAELGFVRIDPDTNVKRLFSLTVKGREQAALLADKRVPPSGGRAPSIERVLAWLLEQESEAPEHLASPARLVPAAIKAGLIDESAREPLAARILDLHSQAYLEGYAPTFDQATAEQRLGMCTEGLRLTMKAHEHAKGGNGGNGNTVNFHGDVAAGQIAAGDVNNYVSLSQLLDRAAEEIAALDEVDEQDRAEALGLIEVLRGKAAGLTADVLTGAGGGLLATVLAQLLGLPRAA